MTQINRETILVYTEDPPKRVKPNKKECRAKHCHNLIMAENLEYCSHCQYLVKDWRDQGLTDQDITFLINQPEEFPLERFREYIGLSRSVMWQKVKTGKVATIRRRGGYTKVFIYRLHAARLIGQIRTVIPASWAARRLQIPFWLLVNLGEVFDFPILIPSKTTFRNQKPGYDNRDLPEIEKLLRKVLPLWEQGKLKPSQLPTSVTIQWLATASGIHPNTLLDYRNRGKLKTELVAQHQVRKEWVIKFLLYLSRTDNRVTESNRKKARNLLGHLKELSSQ